ncbi:RNA polymerase factor sigma-54 [uncultured Clostridium sp.]|uniref:RNA polymerase factor sigma-54 n=1 Tax=uncultured Clostridium sp. TaxID=59620 RepID=UPI0025E15E42|nr:RNA polymerase factor sigma-54 [uncultured Clostridium sp.]MDU4882422.1 RNA polymerase factor sigma-54 [Clostridium celatum]MDU7075872.1 RNA polymerase factor sigma-54 [Clostridium celatum]
MQMDFKLDILQKQKLILTQTMQQSINILQMSAYELREYIDKKFEENPVLEGELDLVESKEKTDNSQLYKYLEDIYSENYNYQYNNEDDVSIFNFIANKKSLKDYLYEQLGEVKSDIKIKKIVSYMIESLDSRGYLENTLEEICDDLGVNKEVGKDALKILQSLEPCGIGARNIKECLLIQLKNKGILDEIIKEIILKYLEYMADCKYNYIAKELKITPKEVQAYGDIIKTLEPKPARGYYTGEEIKFIIPDAYIVKIRDEYSVIMNKDIIPNITINNLYKQEILNGKDKREVEYVKEKVNDAISLITDIEQRNNTILKLLECIVKKQKAYFENGQEYLKPMTMRELANEMCLHESTVSRAIKDKYILTSRGTIKIKDLFCNRIISSGIEGEDVSTNTIKNKIKQLIKLENKSKPLSDQAICDLLNKEDIAISRRTVAKYREELDIKSSTKRKRF